MNRLFVGNALEVTAIEVNRIKSVHIDPSDNNLVTVATDYCGSKELVYKLKYSNSTEAANAIVEIGKVMKGNNPYEDNSKDTVNIPPVSEPIKIEIRHIADEEEETMKKMFLEMVPAFKTFMEKNGTAIEKIGNSFEKMGEIYGPLLEALIPTEPKRDTVAEVLSHRIAEDD